MPVAFSAFKHPVSSLLSASQSDYRIWTTMTPTPWVTDNYPPTHRSDHVDIYQSASSGEVQVSDPYQWLEETSDEVDQWTTAQTNFTQEYLNKNPNRQKLEDKFLASKDYAKVIDDRS